MLTEVTFSEYNTQTNIYFKQFWEQVPFLENLPGSTRKVSDFY